LRFFFPFGYNYFYRTTFFNLITGRRNCSDNATFWNFIVMFSIATLASKIKICSLNNIPSLLYRLASNIGNFY